MKLVDDPFVAPTEEAEQDSFTVLAAKARSSAANPHGAHISIAQMPFAVAVGRLLGFSLIEEPLVGELDACPGEVLPTRSAVALRPTMIGREVVVNFEGGDPRRAIIMGVLEAQPRRNDPAPTRAPATVEVDGGREVIEAEREIVLRCGEASITLTRAGKVIIKGNYVLSRSTGYNKIKGAAIDIN